MSNKTNVGYYNEDDFVENNETLRELTVTITLCEYRNLITERTRNENEIAKLQDELTTANKQIKSLQSVIIKRTPDFTKELAAMCAELLGTNEAGEEKGETEDTDEKEEGR